MHVGNLRTPEVPELDLQVTELCKACSAGNATVVLRLLASQVNPNWIDIDGRLPLIEATRSGAHNIVALLIMAGADPQMSTTNKSIALDYAYSDPVIIQLLTESLEEMSLNSPWENNWKDEDWKTARRALKWAKAELEQAKKSWELIQSVHKMNLAAIADTRPTANW